MMESRSAKRTRHACEPCRRKKARCPGERPICSFCARLKQSCRYSDDMVSSIRHASAELQLSSAWEQRLKRLEEKMDMVLDRILPSLSQESSCPAPRQEEEDSSPPFTWGLSPEAPPSSCRSPQGDFLQGIPLPATVIIGLVETYIRRCDCQPLSIFNVDSLRQSVDTCAPEILYSILALALRFLPSPQVHDDPAQLAAQFAEKARRIVMEKITEGTAYISALQSLCLQAFFDVGVGNTQRAWVSTGIGMRLIMSAKLNSESRVPVDHTTADELRRCFWSFYMLECLCSDSSNAQLVLPHERPPYPLSLCLRSENEPDAVLQNFGNYPLEKAQDIGIIGYSVQLVELWKKTLQYTTSCLKSTEAPWSSGSGYFKMAASVMEWETYLCKNHRAAHTHFAKQSSSSLLLNLRYWAPWLNIQFLYHGTLCLINHPFFLFEKVKGFAGVISTSFVETASNMALFHAKHITRFIINLEQKHFEASDPFLGYCASVAATAYLWYCHIEDRVVKEQAQARFTTCFKFIARLGSKWPIAKKMASNLVLAKTRAASWKYSSEPPFAPIEIPSSDMSIIWNLLSYPVKDISQEPGKSILSPTLNLDTTKQDVSPPNSIQNSTRATSYQGLNTPFPSVMSGLASDAAISHPVLSIQEEFAMAAFVDNIESDMFNDIFNGRSFAFEDGNNYVMGL
ncbi:hypothetical protein F5884DRAFT_814764 [Xylogone sp. PMI_703]|nr:hypothetical protein F5884DRAFT_814764 [Xylogone sp. PMI_703]